MAWAYWQAVALAVIVASCTAHCNATTYQFTLDKRAEQEPGPPVLLNDVINITIPKGFNAYLLRNITDWHYCDFDGATLQASKGFHLLNVTKPGYIYVASSSSSGTDCLAGARAVFYVPKAEDGKQPPIPLPDTNATATYDFVVSQTVATPDCVAKSFAAVNGQLPGPAIRVKQFTNVIVHVRNNLTQALAIHWHGIRQKGTQWMDGNAFASQCPIPPGKSFTYRFNVGEQVGTFWWHAHAGFLRQSVFGALIVEGQEDLPPAVSEEDRLLFVHDWYYRSDASILAGLEAPPPKHTPLEQPNSILINGRGRTDCAAYHAQCKSYCLLCRSVQAPNVCQKYENIAVTEGKTYRFRVINAGMYGQVNLQIEGHKFTIIEEDGNLLKPVTYSSMDIFPGQAFSLLVTPNRWERHYWIAAIPKFDNFGGPQGRAIMSYYGADEGEPEVPFPRLPNKALSVNFSPQQVFSYRSIYRSRISGRTVTRPIGLRWAQNLATVQGVPGRIRYSVNNYSFVPQSTPLLYAHYNGLEGAFESGMRPVAGPPVTISNGKLPPCNAGSTFVEATVNDLVEIVFQNNRPPGLQHPWHLHGYSFYLVAHGFGEYNFSLALNQQPGLQSYIETDPPFVNTFTVYNNGWAVIRFIADNPGMWHLHCHMEPHAHLGMQTFLRVEGSLPAPPAGYLIICQETPIPDTPIPKMPAAPDDNMPISQALESPMPPLPGSIPSAAPPQHHGVAGDGSVEVDFVDGVGISGEVTSIKPGGKIALYWSGGGHAICADYDGVDMETYKRTDAYLRDLVKVSGPKGIQLFDEPPNPSLGPEVDYDTVEVGITMVLTFPNKGMYIFTCNTHWKTMMVRVLVQ